MDEYELKDSGARRVFDTGAQRDRGEQKTRPDLISPFFLDRVGMVCAKGAEKYAPRNWEKGMPLSEFLASAERHLMQFKMGLTDEDHIGQCAWNLMCIIHFQELNVTELDDFPIYQVNKKPNTWEDIKEVLVSSGMSADVLESFVPKFKRGIKWRL